jgi:hypothetical protein
MTDRIWILGASDPIERLLRECGESVVHVANEPIHIGDATTVYTVDCDPPLAVGTGWGDPGAYHQPLQIGARWYPRAEADYTRRIVRIGRRCPPSEFLPDSSIGQVIAELARLSPCPLPAEWDTDYVPGLALGQYFRAQDARYLVGTEDGPMYVPRDIVRAAARNCDAGHIISVDS